VAWALSKVRPNPVDPNHMLLQHFYTGLDTKSAFYLDITARGSFSHKTPSEGREILDHITENTFVANSRPSREERTSSHEDILAAKSDLPLPTTLDSALEPSRKPRVP
jgi:hypothetical protein